ncbi:LCP family protein [Mycobacterium avium]|uniref:LCP family protein n=8 Tax=Mycobacterium avium TaxID=1764 RepID=UPI001CDA9687|nr:LCP family protein [Mycobacterium avium]
MNGDFPPRGRRPGRQGPPRQPGPEPSPVIPRPGGPAPSPHAPTQPLHRPPPTPPARPAPPTRPAPTASAIGPARPRRKRRWIRAVASALLVVLLLAGVGLGAGVAWFDTKLHREPVLADYPGRPEPGRGSNWLIVGSDSRQGLSAEQQQQLATGGDIGDGRTDTILLVHLPGVGSGVAPTMVSIPRDSYVPIPEHGKDKINAAFAMGGATLLVRTVEQATGLRIAHYAEIGFGGFAALVDALGGVRVCPQAPMHDPLAGLDLPAGCQTLDGRNALGYVRSRDTPRADLDRMVNQRQFVAALLHRAASPAVWLNPWRWYAAPRAVADALTVDRADHAWDLARLGWALHGSPATVTVPIGEFTSGDAGSVVVWDHARAARLFDALSSDGQLPAGSTDEQQPSS